MADSKKADLQDLQKEGELLAKAARVLKTLQELEAEVDAAGSTRALLQRPPRK